MTESPLDGLVDASIRRKDATKPLVLFAAPRVSESTQAFKRAHELARSLGGEFVFLRVSSPSFNATAKPAREAIHGVLDRSGDFLPVVREAAKALRPTIIAIPKLSGHTGRSVHALALECDVPIMVARGGVESRVILAASDLSNPSFPVLRTGALLSGDRRGHILFLHNLAPTFSYGARTSATLKGCPPSVVDRLDDLRLAARALNVQSENVVTIRPDVDEALLSVIDRERPDIVIVGARARRSPYSREASLAQTMFDEIAPSIVVVPLDRAPASDTPLSDHGMSS